MGSGHQHRPMRPIRFRVCPLTPAQSTLGRRSPAPCRSTVWLWRQRLSGATRGSDAVGSEARVADILQRQFGALGGGWRMQRSPHGRPQLPPASGLDLSISHAGDCWLLALGANPRRLGVDIERLQLRPRALEVAERYFPAAEVALLKSLSTAARSRAFLRLWCAREAILKAHGRGIAFGLARLQLTLTPDRIQLLDCDAELGAASRWRLREFVPRRGMLGVLAWQGPPAVLRGCESAS